MFEDIFMIIIQIMSASVLLLLVIDIVRKDIEKMGIDSIDRDLEILRQNKRILSGIDGNLDLIKNLHDRLVVVEKIHLIKFTGKKIKK